MLCPTPTITGLMVVQKGRGQQLIERLRRLQIEGDFSWVEALPQVLDRLHETPGEGGLSPYHILFGRERP